ncbi:PD-(D/E)XK nuclease family protein [Halomonas desiderata]|uniref:PD-(D/E)XK nuclease family protein n=1 Tax=Billgrantia desiderata TaxID=52021 RepID=UPI00174D9CB2|nr:PD-(D/E)XK nuclease family protein [Halomonas desiderata]
MSKLEKQDSLVEFFEKLDLMPIPETPIPNLFTAAGLGQNENRLSDLMALFMGSHAGAPRWLAKALVNCLWRKGALEVGGEFLDETEWDDVRAEREVGAWDAGQATIKRMDLVIYCDKFVVGVEHKIWSSASYNPFMTYEKLIDSYDVEVKARCVLRPNLYDADVPSNWCVVSYAELLDVAYEMYGRDIATLSHQKWQVFYQELLQHLHTVANPKEAKTMSQKELSFSLKHFHHLREAEKLLVRLEAELIQEGKSFLSAALSLDESEVKCSTSTWHDNQRVLRFFPFKWNEQTQICLIYYSDLYESEADETVGFFLRVFVDSQGGYKDIEGVRNDFLSSVPAEKVPHLSFYREGGEKDTWYESNRRYMALDVWPREFTKSGAMIALGELAKWIDDRLVDIGSHPAELAGSH